jgi:hypothetical protein
LLELSDPPWPCASANSGVNQTATKMNDRFFIGDPKSTPT